MNNTYTLKVNASELEHLALVCNRGIADTMCKLNFDLQTMDRFVHCMYAVNPALKPPKDFSDEETRNMFEEHKKDAALLLRSAADERINTYERVIALAAGIKRDNVR